MALHFDLTKIKDMETVCFEKVKDKKQMKAVTNAIIWSTIVSDLGTITEKNASEFYLRLVLADAACGSKTKDITAEDVRQHIGLHCNVNDASFAKFAQKLKRMVQNEAYRMDKKAAEKAKS